jgi:hypothetical protein
MSKLKDAISRVLGIKEWKLNAEGKLDVTAEELGRMTAQYGGDFITKFEKFLAGEARGQDAGNNETAADENENTNKPESDMLKLEILCALLAVESIALSEDGNATLSKEQLEAIEAGLKKLQDEKTSSESTLAETIRLKDGADKALSEAVTAMDDLDASVKEAASPAAKVEAIRKKLAEKPGAAATGAQTEGDRSPKKIEGADPATQNAQDLT